VSIEQHSILRSIILHLLPGALIALFFAITAQAVVAAGYPSIDALLLAILIVLLPIELGYLIYQGRARNGTISLSGIVLNREPIPAWQYLALVVPLILWGGLIFAISGPLDGLLSRTMFTWLPDWYFFGNFAEHVSEFSRSALTLTIVLLLVLNGVLGPVVEEMYFRGYLLPRISRFGRWAPVINTVLFSLYHFWSPWQIITRIIAVLPLVSAVYWKRNIYVGMLTHVLLNTLGVLLTAGLILSRL
jgi:membrane protease YdiL (CAAX protease family)